MLQHSLASRLCVTITGDDRPPSVVADAGSGGLGVDPARRGITIYECDWQRMIRLSATEALELLALLRTHAGVLQRMATEDSDALVEAARGVAERAWQAPAVCGD